MIYRIKTLPRGGCRLYDVSSPRYSATVGYDALRPISANGLQERSSEDKLIWHTEFYCPFLAELVLRRS